MQQSKKNIDEKKPAQGYDEQIILKKKWGLFGKGGTIRKKAIRCGKENCTKCPHEFYAYHVEYLLGKYLWKYLGKCDNLGRPVQSLGKSKEQ